MRLSVIKHNINEKVLYNPAVFIKNEDLIIFPFKEFDKFYNETVENLNVVKNIIKDSLNQDSATTPKEGLEYVEDWINLIQEDMDLLIKFDTQTTLNSFQSREKPKNKASSVNNMHKEQIQCLIGL